jgi:hypothetical protein
VIVPAEPKDRFHHHQAEVPAVALFLGRTVAHHSRNEPVCNICQGIPRRDSRTLKGVFEVAQDGVRDASVIARTLKSSLDFDTKYRRNFCFLNLWPVAALCTRTV